MKIKTLTVRLDDSLHQEFKIYSIKQGKDMQAILIEYIKKLLDEDSQAK
ncbi:hypothetical protein [Anaerotruncus sp. AF02-27]|nr:hypothetical protein [Anaerotruncus sp. AF02-27]